MDILSRVLSKVSFDSIYITEEKLLLVNTTDEETKYFYFEVYQDMSDCLQADFGHITEDEVKSNFPIISHKSLWIQLGFINEKDAMKEALRECIKEYKNSLEHHKEALENIKYQLKEAEQDLANFNHLMKPKKDFKFNQK